MSEFETLINLVKEQPCIYDKRDDNFKNFEVKEQVWHVIALKMDCPGTLRRTNETCIYFSSARRYMHMRSYVLNIILFTM